MTSRSLKLTLAYDGSAYHGWQIQAEGNTVQAELERAWATVSGESIRVTASGRTDAGVHALGQVVSLNTNSVHDCPTWLRALNGNLPEDIRVLDVQEAEPGFHAIRDAVSKRYRYFIQDGGIADPFLRGWCWYLPGRLDDCLMQEAASELMGKHDFATYQSAGSPRSTTERTIHDFRVDRQAGQLCEPIVIEVAADGFLYNMVRNLVGTLVEVGAKKQPTDWPHGILERRDRRLAGQTAPARGLFLVSVDYGEAEESQFSAS